MKHIEADLQYNVIQYMQYLRPRVLYTISPQGMKLPLMVAVRIKYLGYRKGTPDIWISESRGGFHGMYLELKAPKGKMTPEQVEFFKDARERGYYCACADSFNAAREYIQSYLTCKTEPIVA